MLFTCGVGLCASTAIFAKVGSGISFAPHRAVYNITLHNSAPGSGVTEMKGRMVYEIVGSACEGYTQNMRFVTRMSNRKGIEQMNDIRTSTWEGGEGERLRFNTTQYHDRKLALSTQGDAKRQSSGGMVKVELAKPSQKNVTLQPKTIFPMQHAKAIIEAARSGKGILKANLFDGSDRGQKVYETTAIIGSQWAPGAKAIDVPAKNVEPLSKLVSWPVAISYFEMNTDKIDALPVYELSYRYFENGVTSRLVIDYGDFAIAGKLQELTFLDEATCK